MTHFEPTLPDGATSTPTVAANEAKGSEPPPAMIRDSTARHVDDLFKKWTRFVSDKLRMKGRTGTEKFGPGQEGDPALDLSRPVPIQSSVFAAQDDRSAEEDKSEGLRTARSKGKGAKPEFMTLDHDVPLSHESFSE